MSRRRAAAAKATPVAAKAPLILVVDDFADNREMYSQFLSFSGYRVAEAQNGHEALEKAFQLAPDLIVMDLSLPGLDGWEATRRREVHQDRKSTRLNSSHSSISYAVFCLKKKKTKINNHS